MGAVGKLPAVVCLAATVMVSVLISVTTSAQYDSAPEVLQDYAAMGRPRMRHRLDSPVFRDETVKDIATQLLKVLPVNISETCANQSAYFLGHLDTRWALQMLDALGKPPSGLMELNGVWLGDFDECVGVSTGKSDAVSFSGQYCLINYPIKVADQAASLHIGSCVPSGCGDEDTAALFNTVLQLLNIHNATGFTAACHLADRPYDAGTYVAIVIFAVFTALLALGTIYDIGKTLRSSMQVYSKYHRLDSDCKTLSESVAAANEETCLINGPEKIRGRPSERIATIEKLVLSFSLYSNGKKLLGTAQGDSTLSCLHGIRFLSMCWVILGHTYLTSQEIASDPADLSVLKRRSFQVINNATVSVDTFFVLSGLLVTYLLLQQLNKVQGSLKAKEWALLYVHRYVRLTPVYMILLVVWTWLANHFYDGPLWPTKGSFDSSCPTYWWTNLLYINNFVPTKYQGIGGCMPWSWYLANDMQFFLLTPPLAYLLYRNWRIGVGITSVLIVSSVGAAAGVMVSDSFGWSNSNADYFDDFYIKPWCRFMSYGVGILLGFLIYKRKDKRPPPLSVVGVGWMIAAASCLAVVYGPYDAEFGSRSAMPTLGEAVAYNSLSRLAWAIGLSWLIFACSSKCGGWINTLLSWKPFMPLGRLTYCAYLIHPIIMNVAVCASRQIITLDDVTMIFRFLGILVISLALAFVASLAFEAPVIGVERILLHPGERK